MRGLQTLGAGMALAAGLACAAPASAEDTAQEAANKRTVLAYFAALNQAEESNTIVDRIDAIAAEYLSPDYAQHSAFFETLPGPGTPRERLVRFFKSMPANAAGPMAPQRTDGVMAEGDRVMLLTSREQVDPATGKPRPSYTFNMFRVSNGKLVEHWDVMESMPPLPGADKN